MDTERICQHCGKPIGPKAIGGLCPECMLKVGLGSGVHSEGGLEKGVKLRPAPPIAEIAPHFPQLEIIELLGAGGMGAVYKARQHEIDRLVALKILPLQAGSDPGFAERFTREARALAKLSHPNIVALYEFGQVNGLHYFIMEYVDGPNLRQLEQAGKLSARQALQIIPQICEALQFAHDEGIVHRDIKPENVLLDKKGRVKIADFGLAKILGRDPEVLRLTGAKDFMGTPHYMAPEQVEKPQTVDHRADIYSLGVVFYEMLTGELPLGKFQPPSRKVAVDVRLDEIVLHTLEKEPERRYQHASQVKTDVESVTTTPPPVLMPLPASVAAETNAWQPAILIIALVVSSALLLAAAILPFPADLFALLFGAFGFIVGAVKLAGLWPLPSPIFPRSGFTGRNLARLRRRPDAVKAAGRRVRSTWARAAKAGLVAFTTIFAVLAIITLLLPRSYEGKAKIIVRDEKLNSVRNDGELDWALRDVIWSFRGPLLQDQIVTEVKLRERWARRFKTPDLKEDEARALLAEQLRIDRIPRTAMFEISCFNTRADEAAEIANKAAEIFCATPAGEKASLIERATPPRHPARPNEPLNLAFAAATALVLGVVFAAGVLLLAVLRPRDAPAAAQPVPKPDPSTEPKSLTAARWTARVLGTLCGLIFLVFLAGEGSPPVGAQPVAVQVEFTAVAIMFAGFITGWWRDGWAALLTLTGWTLFYLAERHVPAWSMFHVAAIVGALFTLVWGCSHKRMSVVVMAAFPFLFGAVI